MFSSDYANRNETESIYNRDREYYDKYRNLDRYFHNNPKYIPDPIYDQFSLNEPDYLVFSWNMNAYLSQKKSLFRRVKETIFASEIDEDHEKEYILKNVVGYLKPGSFCAIMGSSGSGKTTMLNILTLREKNLEVESDIRLNGKPVGFDELSSYSGYVKQNDLFIDVLTVREWLIFQAFMRIGEEMTDEEKYNRVDEVLSECNITKIEDNYIGGLAFTKGISGGEKRLLSFATQILTNPTILFCDEPTSGLDTYTASIIIDILENQARTGKTILCSIHQPSTQMFQKFNTICLMSEGRIAYFGPTEHALNYFERFGYQCPLNYNPADFLIAILHVSVYYREHDLLRVNQILDSYQNSEYYSSTVNYVNLLHYDQSRNDEIENFTLLKSYKSSIFSQFKWLLWRNFLVDTRNFYSFIFISFTLLFTGVFIGFTYFQIPINEKNITNINGLIILIVLVFGYIFFNPILSNYIHDMPIFFRDNKDKLYSSAVYFISKQVAEFPKFFVLGVIVMTTIYWLSNLKRDAGVFFAVLFVALLAIQCSLSLAYLISLSTQDIRLSIEIAASFVISNASFLVLVEQTTPLKWLKYLSWLYYMYDSVMYLVYHKYQFIPCTKPTVNITVGNITETCSNPLCYSDGNDVLDRFNISNSGLARNIIVTFVILVVLRVLAYFVLKLRAQKA